MSELAENLEKVILRAGIDGALTEDAVAQFHALVKQRDALDVDNKRLDEKNTELEERIRDVSERYNKASTCAQEWAGREQDLMDREAKCTELEIRKECADLRVTDHQKMVELVFRNTVLKKQVVTPGSGTIDQYGTRNSEFPDTTPVEEEDT
jgi:uncharacterized protein (DUF3084 family)